MLAGILVWSAWLTLLNTWVGNFGWGAFYFAIACITLWFLGDAIDDLEHWNDYEEDEACFCIHPVYPSSGHRPHLNPRNYDD